MADIALNQREHPLYGENSDNWSMYAEAALGGDSFINDEYLFSHRLEDSNDFSDRLERAYYLNYCDAIPTIYNTYIFRAGIERSPNDPDLELLRKNIDGRGTAISSFIKRLGYLSSVYGVIHALVDMPVAPKKVVSKRVAKEKSLFPYCSIVYPGDLVDWSLDEYGNYLWIILKSIYYRDSDPNVERVEETHYKLITREEWKIEDDKGEAVSFDDGTPNSGPNELGIIPLVTMYHKDLNDDRIGESLIKDIVYVNRAVLNWCSCIDEQIERQTFSQLVIPDDGSLVEASETDDDPLRKVGTASAWTFPSDSTHPPSFINPSAESISTIWTLVVDHIKEMFRLGGLQGGTSDLYTSSSGRQSQMSFLGVNSSLAEKAARYEKCENDIYRMVYLQLGKDPDAVEYVSYPTQFNVVALEDEIDAHLKIMGKNFSPVLNKTMMKNIARSVVPLAPQSIRKEIETEIDAGDGNVSAGIEPGPEVERDGDGNTNTALASSFKSKKTVDDEKRTHRVTKKE